MKGREHSSPVTSSTSVEVTQVDVLNGGGIVVEKCDNLIGQQEGEESETTIREESRSLVRTMVE